MDSGGDFACGFFKAKPKEKKDVFVFKLTG